jgi:hypothetical protein
MTMKNASFRVVVLLPVAFTVSCVTASLQAFAEATRFHTYEGFSNFLDGDAKGASLTSNGQIELAPSMNRVFEEKEGRISAVAADNGRVALAFAVSGRLLVIDEAGKKNEWGEVPKGVVTALAFSKGALYVATLGPLNLYRFTGPKKIENVALPELQKRPTAAIWDMVDTKKGLHVATASPGAVYRLDGAKFVEVFKSNEDSLRSVTTDENGVIYAGGGSKGIVYRSNDKGAFTALYDSGLDEVTDLYATKEGDVFVLGLSGAASKDVRAEKIAEKGKIRSQLVRVDREGFSDVLAGSDDEILYAVAPVGDGRVFIATGSVDKDNQRGRLYTTQPKTREIALAYQTPAAQVVALAPLGGKKIAVVTNDPPAVEVLSDGYAKEGEFSLPVFDAQTQSRFGSVQLEGRGQILVRLRTGQTSTPDSTWSAWTKDVPAGMGPSALPPGRFVQAKVLLKGDGKSTPNARRVRLAYARNNLPPFVSEISLLPRNVQLTAVPTDTSRERTVAVNDKGILELKRIGEPPAQDPTPKARQTMVDGALSVIWAAADPNGDDLWFDLYVRNEGEAAWRMLKQGLMTPFHSFSGASLPDGHYQFKVVASDEPSNAPSDVKRESRESAVFVIDNTPPKLSKVDASRQRVRFTAQDTASVLTRAEYALDGSALRPLAAKDGLVDSKEETFELDLPKDLSKDPHVITVRLQDESGNVVSGEARFRASRVATTPSATSRHRECRAPHRTRETVRRGSRFRGGVWAALSAGKFCKRRQRSCTSKEQGARTMPGGGPRNAAPRQASARRHSVRRAQSRGVSANQRRRSLSMICCFFDSGSILPARKKSSASMSRSFAKSSGLFVFASSGESSSTPIPCLMRRTFSSPSINGRTRVRVCVTVRVPFPLCFIVITTFLVGEA